MGESDHSKLAVHTQVTNASFDEKKIQKYLTNPNL